jgi:hypothetical protein
VYFGGGCLYRSMFCLWVGWCSLIQFLNFVLIRVSGFGDFFFYECCIEVAMVVWVWMKNKKNRRPWKKKNNGKRKNRMKKKKGARLHEKLWEERDCIFLFYL